MRLNQQHIPELLLNSDTHASTLLLIALDVMGDDLFGAESEEAAEPTDIWVALNKVYGVWVTEEGENKLNALMTAMESERFYLDPEVFSAVCLGLSTGDIGDFVQGMFESPDVIEIMWTVTEVELIREDPEGDIDFSPAVTRLIKAAFSKEAQDFEIEGTTTPYYQKHLDEEFKEMMKEFRLLGVKAEQLKYLDARAVKVFDELEEETRDILGV